MTLTPPQRFAQAEPSSTQQVPFFSQIAAGLSHAPLLPHATLCPQLFVAVPHCLPVQVVAGGSGTQPHALCTHVSPPSQPPHCTDWEQLSVDGPQRLSHQLACGAHWQVPAVHVCPSPQSVEQWRVAPQLSMTSPQRPLHVTELGSGVHELASVDPSTTPTTPPSSPGAPVSDEGIDPSIPGSSSAGCVSPKFTPARTLHPTPKRARAAAILGVRALIYDILR